MPSACRDCSKRMWKCRFISCASKSRSSAATRPGSIASPASANRSPCFRPKDSLLKVGAVHRTARGRLSQSPLPLSFVTTYAQQSRARRRREKALRIEPGQGALPESRVHQRSGDRLLRPDRAGALAAPRRSAADNETLSKRRGRRIFLRKELSAASPEVGQDGEGLE